MGHPIAGIITGNSSLSYFNSSTDELLVAACKEDNLDMLEEVLSADASSFDINHTDGLGNAALHYAYVLKVTFAFFLLS